MSFNTLIKGIDILNLFLRKRASLAAGDISKALKLPKSTTYKYLAVLMEKGLLDRDSATGEYRLGFRLFEYGSLVQAQNPLHKIALPYMRRLSDEVGETVILSVLRNRVAYCLERVESEKGIIFSMQRGAYLPLHSGASAKILLAFLPDEEIDLFLKQVKLARYTKYTITEPRKLKANLREIRELGYAFSDQEVDIGARAISAPIFNYAHQVIGGLSVAGPIQRLDKRKIEKLKSVVVQYARNISRELSGKERQKM